jgi:hypothetical protein
LELVASFSLKSFSRASIANSKNQEVEGVTRENEQGCEKN